MNPFYHSTTPLVPGSLHRLSQEHDNCGMGAIAHLKGERSYKVLDYALTSVCAMTHRGAVDADMKTGDGSGVLTQIPYPLFRKAAAALGHMVENDADLAVAVFFFPAEDAAKTEEIKAIAAEVTDKRGIPRIGWREVPVDPDALGKIALASRPHSLSRHSARSAAASRADDASRSRPRSRARARASGAERGCGRGWV